MIDPIQGKVLFYPVALIPGRSGSGRTRPGPFRWGRPCDTTKEAGDELKRAIESDGASMGFVVRFPERNGEVSILVNYTKPESVRKIVLHYVDLCDLIDDEHPPG